MQQFPFLNELDSVLYSFTALRTPIVKLWIYEYCVLRNQVLKGNGVQIVVDHLIKSIPKINCFTDVCALTLIYLIL